MKEHLCGDDWVEIRKTPMQTRAQKGLEDNELILFSTGDGNPWFGHARDMLALGDEFKAEDGFGISQLPDYIRLAQYMVFNNAQWVEDL